MLDSLEFAQDEAEFAGLLEQAKLAQSFLEIGSRFGQSAIRVAKVMPKNSRIVCVDLPNADDNAFDSLPDLKERMAEIVAMGYDANLFVGNSRDAWLIEAVRALGPYDLCFIDGDHSYAGVLADWQAYGPMARVVAFHDIAGPEGSASLWKELKPRHRHIEFTDSGWMGIGILFKD